MADFQDPKHQHGGEDGATAELDDESGSAYGSSDDESLRNECWDKAAPVPGRDPARWRYDAAGNVVVRRLLHCEGCLCYDFDHIVPYSKGGLTEQDNCQILQTRANRWKSDKLGVTKEELRGVSCDLELSAREMDLLELSLWGDIKRDGAVYKHLNLGQLQQMTQERKEGSHL